MKKQKLSWPILLGIGLLVFFFSFMVLLQIRMYIGSRESKVAVSKLEAILPEEIPGVPGSYPNAGMPVLELDGADYVAMLDIPAFGIELPVADNWNSLKRMYLPTRFFGSAYDHTLIICGSDYPEQFGFCDKIQNGAYVYVTDMTGARFAYTVSGVERSKHGESQWLMDGDWDLTLYCYDIYSMEYIAVRCAFAYHG